MRAHGSGTAGVGPVLRRRHPGAVPWISVLGTTAILAVALLVILVTGGVLPVVALGAIAPLLAMAFFRLSQEQRIVALILTISVPVSVPLLGKDGGTATTFLIFFAVAVSVTDLALRRLRLSFYRAEVSVYFLVLVGLASLVTRPPAVMLNAFRFYYLFLSGLLLFLLIVKSAPKGGIGRDAYVARLLDALVVVVAGQVVIGLLVYFVPSAGAAFRFVMPRNEEELAVRVTDESIRRLTTLIAGPEPTGEMLAVLAPLVLHKYFTGTRSIYLWVFLAMGGAEILTATRSTNLLFALGALTVVYAHSARIRASKLLTLVLAVIAGGVLVLLIRPDFADALLTRFGVTHLAPGGAGEVSASLNRAAVWSEGVSRLADLPPFGHGFARVLMEDGSVVQFHSLYLTSLYQLGWIGAPVFFGLLLVILGGLWKVSKTSRGAVGRSLAFCMAVAFSIFLVNEIKYEFNRHPPYLHLCWVFIALAYLVSRGEPRADDIEAGTAWRAAHLGKVRTS